MKQPFFAAAILIVLGIFTGCEKKPEPGQNISVVTTIFAPYDFVRAIAGDRAEVTMLLKPGAESHSYEPTPQDIISIRNSDIFIYVGGESDEWVDQVLESMDDAEMRIITLMDCVDLVEEEIVEGMEEEEEEEEGIAYDEHVWTSPANAKRMVEKISAALSDADPDNAGFYRANTDAYIGELDALDAAFRSVTDQAKRRTLVFGDRFPFRYFTDAYDLSYFAAFPGCSTETECSAATVAFLIDKVKAEQIPVVFHIEFSNGSIADTICEATEARKRMLHSAHNVSRDELAAGTTYLDIMNRNAEVLREALW
ncbi:MAG: metal ABC transporter substrate-binding protein [Spirochaetaceae bacterium]|jgi:zinc transport system substrate-binding protein|nr:metal ABC transporter substrate-binding protein [Spirochaetaceae bacterium]